MLKILFPYRYFLSEHLFLSTERRAYNSQVWLTKRLEHFHLWSHHLGQMCCIILIPQMVKAIAPICPNCQHVSEPEWLCLLPKIDKNSMKHISSHENSLELSILGTAISSECDNVVLPLTTYSLMFFKVEKRNHSSIDLAVFPEACPEHFEDCRHIANYAVHENLSESLDLQIKGLKHFSAYAVFVKAQNVYGASQVIISSHQWDQMLE